MKVNECKYFFLLKDDINFRIKSIDLKVVGKEKALDFFNIDFIKTVNQFLIQQSLINTSKSSSIFQIKDGEESFLNKSINSE